ncbi:MAG: N-acetylmuramoyl-L-alanine amidase, partial [Akkermansia sp.]|nr:N-acetylmuramoyl-L-alanine amidase [Akkermansia sp.]
MRLILQYVMLMLTLTLGVATAFHAQADDTDWQVWKVGGVEYVEVEDACKFYKYLPKQGRPGFKSYGSARHTISVKANKQDFYVNNFRYILSYPIKEHNGKLLISAVDMKKLVDPVLRPTYNKQAGVITTVVIDAGHGGHDAGAVSPWAREKDCNLAVARKVRDKLKKAGISVVMTRDSDVFLTLGERVAIANKTPNCVFVSIHHNSGRRAAKGIETFTLAPHGT